MQAGTKTANAQSAAACQEARISFILALSGTDCKELAFERSQKDFCLDWLIVIDFAIAESEQAVESSLVEIVVSQVR